MIALELLLFYLLSFAEVRAGGHATCTDGTSNLSGSLENIQQRIWDRGIFDALFDFFRNDLPSLEDQISHNNLEECGAPGLTRSIGGDCVSTSTATINGVPSYGVACNNLAVPATDPLGSDVVMVPSSSQSALTCPCG